MKKTKLVFCNIGWMENYKGQGVYGDLIEGGGAHNDDNVGYEVCNFLEVGDQVYGYVETGGSINLERITARKKEGETISGVTVVWTAKRPKVGTVIVGWYKNATVHRNPIQWLKDKKSAYYNILASVNDTTLLPINEREFSIPRKKPGFMGKKNIWYANKDYLKVKHEVNHEVKNKVDREVKQFVSKVKKYIDRRIPQISDVDKSAIEGGLKMGSHFYRERSAKLVNAKKDEVFERDGKLCCEVCSFDFAATYGKFDKRYCEAHHKVALSEYDGEAETTSDDLAIVCSNCHRIIHLHDPMLDIEELKKEIAKVRGA